MAERRKIIDAIADNVSKNLFSESEVKWQWKRKKN